jgi:hypothetical protein
MFQNKHRDTLALLHQIQNGLGNVNDTDDGKHTHQILASACQMVEQQIWEDCPVTYESLQDLGEGPELIMAMYWFALNSSLNMKYDLLDGFWLNFIAT